MATKLGKELKREISIEGKPYIIRIDPDGLKVTEKGRRNGTELLWKALVSGDIARAVALKASVSSD
jgi:hypothetical protein